MLRKNSKNQEFAFGGSPEQTGQMIGTGAGAVAGSFIGMPHVGAAVGGVGGRLIGGFFDDDEEKPIYVNPQTGGLGTQQFRHGGQAEGESSNFKQYKGASHKNGGIQVSFGEVEGGETQTEIDGQPYVFSNRLMVPGEKKTFAQKHKEVKNNPKEVMKLATRQEKINGNSRNNKMAYGGDPTQQQYPPTRPTAPNPMPQDQMVSASPVATQLPEVNETDLAEPVAEGSSPTDIGMRGNAGGAEDGFSAESAVKYIPGMINMARGMFEPSGVEDMPDVDRSGLEEFPEEYNINPQLRANRRNFRAMRQSAPNNMNMNLAGYAQKLSADSQAYANKENQENQMQAQHAQAAQQIAQQQTQLQAQERRQRMAENARRSQMIAQGATQMAGAKQQEIDFNNNLEMAAQILSNPEMRRMFTQQMSSIV